MGETGDKATPQYHDWQQGVKLHSEVFDKMAERFAFCLVVMAIQNISTY